MTLTVRQAARVIVRDPDDSVLLLRYDDAPPNGVHWSTPGGGLDDGEDYATAAARELVEETGWTDVHVAPVEIHRRDLEMEFFGRLVRQHERFFGARVDQVARPLVDVTDMHVLDRIAAWRWWSRAELRASTETVWPAELADLVDALVAQAP